MEVTLLSAPLPSLGLLRKYFVKALCQFPTLLAFMDQVKMHLYPPFFSLRHFIGLAQHLFAHRCLKLHRLHFNGMMEHRLIRRFLRLVFLAILAGMLTVFK
jgi:hypothetical protein